MSRIIRVHVDIGGENLPVGTAVFYDTRGRVVTTFNYDSAYVETAGSYQIDPRLPLGTAPMTISGLPGAFQDAAPDRWGKNLIRREAEQTSTRRKRITEVDFLLEASDLPRQGALRFTTADGEPYLEDHGQVPKVLELDHLLEVATKVQRDDQYPVKELLAAGSDTLGGARPKASVTDADGTLMIAKFPAINDEWDVMRWEQTALTLAARARVDVPSSQLLEIGDQSVVLIDRFDRDQGVRVGYLSAHTLLRPDDVYAADYQDIAELLGEFSDDHVADGDELYRRVAFSVAIRNTDDHLRNHGVLREGTGWRLSPAFDINPNPYLGSSRSTGIMGAYIPDEEAAGLVRLAEELQIPEVRAHQILNEVSSGVADWESAARDNGLGDTDVRRFAPMFENQAAVLDQAQTTIGARTSLWPNESASQRDIGPAAGEQTEGPIGHQQRLNQQNLPGDHTPGLGGPEL